MQCVELLFNKLKSLDDPCQFVLVWNQAWKLIAELSRSWEIEFLSQILEA
jgi:hypothetical protein